MGAGEALSAFWRERSARERAVLLAGGVLLAAAALYGALWDPALAARERLGVALPKLRAQLEDMRLQKSEIERLRRLSAPASHNADLRALLRAAVERSPFPRAVERIEWRAAERVLVAAPAVEFDRWVEWVRLLQREMGVRLDSCEIVALAEPGMVRVEAVFAAGAAP